MIDHVLSFQKQKYEETRYRMYITDALKLISENTAKFVGGSYIAARWYEKKDNDQRSGDEIAKDIIKRANLKVGGE